MAQNGEPAQVARNLFLNLIEKSLLDAICKSVPTGAAGPGTADVRMDEAREVGASGADEQQFKFESMRLRNLRLVAEQALDDKVPGDFFVAGGDAGASVLFKALLEAYGDAERRLFVAGSPGKVDFRKYSLSEERVANLRTPIEEIHETIAGVRLAVLMMECGVYETTLQVLRLLYESISFGGFVIVGVVGDTSGCRKAVEEFRHERGIMGPVIEIGSWGVYWSKGAAAASPAHSPRLELIPAGRQRPFWSVIVPLYERREYLKQCLDSILDQDPGPGEMEISVIDDASPSGLRGFVHGIGRGRVNYVRNAINLGERANTNLAIGRSSGRWIHILHDDDWVLPGFYATMRRGVESAPDSIGTAFCMYASWDEVKRSWWSPNQFREGAGPMHRNFIVRLAIANPLNFAACIHRRETFERVGLFREDLPATGDWEWYVRSALQFTWHHQPETLACYRANHENQTRQATANAKMAIDIRRTLETFARILPADLAAIALPRAREIHGCHYLKAAMMCLKVGNSVLATKFLQEAFAIDPDGAARSEFTQLLQLPTSSDLRRRLGAYIARIVG